MGLEINKLAPPQKWGAKLRTIFMSQTRLYSILWLLIFGVLYSFFESRGWGILSTLYH